MNQMQKHARSKCVGVRPYGVRASAKNIIYKLNYLRTFNNIFRHFRRKRGDVSSLN